MWWDFDEHGKRTKPFLLSSIMYIGFAFGDSEHANVDILTMTARIVIKPSTPGVHTCETSQT